MPTGNGASINTLNETIIRFENSLREFIERFETTTKQSGSSSYTSSSRASRRLVGGDNNIYDQSTNDDAYRRYEQYMNEEDAFQEQIRKKRLEGMMEYWERNNEAVKSQAAFEIEMDERRKQAAIDFWKLNEDSIKAQEEYQIELQNKRQQAELDFFDKKKKEIEKLDELETSLIERRKEKELRGKIRSAELERDTTDDKGRTKSNKELMELRNKFREFHEENTGFRKAGIVTSKVLNGGASAMNTINNGKFDVNAMADKMSGALAKAGPYGAAAGGLIQILKTAFEMYSKVNTAASKFAKSAGGGAVAIREMENRMVKVARHISNADGLMLSFGKRAYDAAKLMDTMAEYSESLGRNTQYMGQMDIKALQDLKDYGINMDVINQFDTFGIAAEDVSKRLAEVYGTAGKHGLNVKAVTSAMTKNLKMAQQYTFAGGQKALERMAEKSVALKYNMEAVSRFADKVSTLEGAAQAGANLSVLGGDFARMGNPLTMLYGGLQDTERLNDMMLNMTKNMAHWDAQNGEMRITAYNRQRLRAAAEAMGVDSNDLINQAMNQGKRNIIDNSMSSAITEESTREFIRNIAKINDKGQAVVNVKTGRKDIEGNDVYEEKLVEKLTEHDRRMLEMESKRKDTKEGATIGDILEQTMSTQEKLDAILEQIKTKIVMGIFRIYNAIVGSWLFGGERIDMTTAGMSKDEEAKFKLLERYQKEQGDNFSKEEMKAIRDMGVKTRSQIKGLNRDELAEFMMYGDVSEKKAYGGIVRGKGTSTSDSIPAMLSNGEFVMNAKATSKHLPELQAMNAEGFSKGSTTPIRAGENQMKSITVEVSRDRKPVYQQQAPTKMSFEPITINITGTSTMKLDCGNGIFKSIDFSKWIRDNINSDVVFELFRQSDFFKNGSLDKSHFRNKFRS